MDCRSSRRPADPLHIQGRVSATSPKRAGPALLERSAREINQVLYFFAEFFGHTITKKGIKMSAALTNAVKNWAALKSIKNVETIFVASAEPSLFDSYMCYEKEVRVGHR